MALVVGFVDSEGVEFGGDETSCDGGRVIRFTYTPAAGPFAFRSLTLILGPTEFNPSGVAVRPDGGGAAYFLTDDVAELLSEAPE